MLYVSAAVIGRQVQHRSAIGCPRRRSDLLSPLPAPFGVHAQDKQARNRSETVWSVSEIDKIGDGVLRVLAHLQRRRPLEIGDFFSPPFAHESPRSATNIF